LIRKLKKAVKSSEIGDKSRFGIIIEDENSKDSKDLRILHPSE